MSCRAGTLGLTNISSSQVLNERLWCHHSHLSSFCTLWYRLLEEVNLKKNIQAATWIRKLRPKFSESGTEDQRLDATIWVLSTMIMHDLESSTIIEAYVTGTDRQNQMKPWKTAVRTKWIVIDAAQRHLAARERLNFCGFSQSQQESSWKVKKKTQMLVRTEWRLLIRTCCQIDL